MPPGRYRLAFDLVEEHRYWLSEIGNAMLRARRRGRPARREPAPPRTSPPEVEPRPDWRDLARSAHAEGYAAVGGSIDAGRCDRAFRA